ncbi:MAG: methylated-DNA--[protein]-cysteine S-methyltransferase [Bacteroidetes bacterium]|nr:methylated-DNA--[protein]-cysteine S-methyltransferase [Bacteroidota bacterium]
MYRTTLQTPIGGLNIETTNWSVIAVYFSNQPYEENTDHPLLNEARAQLKAYFERKTTSFNLPIDPPGTVFQRLVWEEVMKVPFGQTMNYARLAIRCGDEKKTRAVAAANAANPMAIIIPCHRIVGSSGQLTGYAWGLDRKEWLLHLEQHQTQYSLF